MLVGAQVPRLDGQEGFETLQSTADATEWQEAVKVLLVQEVQSRASKALDENAGFLSTIHSSIELFQNNVDLIPGTQEFDVELANRFATMATPYELRNDGKLQGYSIPVQPIVDHLRAQIATERAAKAAAPAGGQAAPAAPAASGGASTPPPAAAAPQAAPEQPQAGIPSKAGTGDSKEDFSALFGTIGLPNLQI